LRCLKLNVTPDIQGLLCKIVKISGFESSDNTSLLLQFCVKTKYLRNSI